MADIESLDCPVCHHPIAVSTVGNAHGRAYICPNPECKRELLLRKVSLPAMEDLGAYFREPHEVWELLLA
jgi:hypothetical protein